MDQVSYRGYARSIGFDPIKAPTEGLARMQERDSRIIRGMEENRRAVKEVRDEYGAGLERKLSIEARDRDQNYQWESKLADNRQKAINVNAQTLIQNELQQGKNTTAALESLAKFSTTIADGITEYRKQKDEADKIQGAYLVASGQISQEEIRNTLIAKTLLKSSGQATNEIVGGLQQRNANPYLVSNLAASNKALHVGMMEAYARQTLSGYTAWAQTKLDEQGLNTAEQRLAAAPQLLGDFLKENGLLDVNPKAIMEPLQRANQAYSGLVEAARKSDIRNKSDDIRSQAKRLLVENPTGESFMEAFNMIATTYADDGATPLGRRGARDELIKLTSDTTLFSDQQVEQIWSNAMTDQGSMKDRFSSEYDQLLTDRQKDKEAEFQIIDAQERRENKRQEEQLLDWIKNNNPNEETLTSIIKEAKTKGIATDRIQAYLAFTTEQQNADFWTKQFREQYELGTLTADDVDQPNVPLEVRETWRTRAQQLDQKRSDSGISSETIKAELTDALKQNLIGDSTNRSAHYSLRGASDYALKLYNKSFQRYAKTMEPATAAAKARLDVLTAIEGKKGAFAVISSSQAKAGQTQAFYAAFTPGKHPGAPTAINVINSSEVIKKVRANSNVVNTEVLASPALLKDINNRITSGKPISIPQIYTDLSRALPGMSPTQILNAQLKAAGLSTQVQPGFRDQLNQINDPALRRILDQPLTQDRLNTTIIGSGNAPATVRTGNNGFTDVMSLGNAAGFKFPQVMAAMWALESGWGNYHSGKNNVFGIKGAGSSVSTEEVVNGQRIRVNASFKDYASPLESAKDYVNLMNNSRYAQGLAQAKTPRQAVEAIAAGGYATDPQYTSKVVKIMQGMGVNVDQPYTPAPPARNQAFMRPTLAYITDNIGPTSTGPHLDVKQQDNPNTPVNEFAKEFAVKALDNFVVVDDPQFGRVPLSRVPVTDTFAGHMARGSHGIDYGTAKGSKVYLQNGARIVSKSRTEHGDKLVIQLPDGRRFSFLHGKSV
jgi:hypothetical protein